MTTGYLRRFPRFADLTDQDVDLLEHVFVVESFQPGHVFVREGDRATALTAAMYVVIDGTIEVSAVRPSGGYAIQRTLAPGELFGHMALVADVVRSATCRASSPVTTARIDRRVFEELYHHDEGIHARFQLVVARQLASDARTLHTHLAWTLTSGDDGALRATLDGDPYGIESHD